jgi:hypothetical protein
MTAQEILSKVNEISFREFEDINFYLLAHRDKFGELGKYSVVNTDTYEGKETISSGKEYEGKWETMTIHFERYDTYIVERRFYIEDNNYQGSEFFQVKPNEGKFEDVEELW